VSSISPLRGCLPSATLREFFAAWAEVVSVIQRLKGSSKGGELIQYPKISPSVSELLAARILVREGIFAAADSISRGGGADLRVVEAGRVWCVEVKGSGSAEFQTFGRKDYDCDLLVWLRFGEAMKIGLPGLVRASLIEHPRQSLGDLGTRVTFATAESAARFRGHELRLVEYALADLVDGE
jgi:hypothetical protein